MQFRNFFILSLFCFFACIFEANAQRVIENENGDRIIVYSDGSWKYFDENDPLDVELLDRILKASQPQPVSQTQPAPVANSRKKRKSKKQVAGTKTKKRKNSKTKSSKPPKSQPAVVSSGVRSRIENVKKVAHQKVSQAEYLEKQMSKNKSRLKKELDAGLVEENITATKLASLKTNVDVASKKLKKAKKARKNLVRYAKMADGLYKKNGTDQAQSLILLENALGVKGNTTDIASTVTTPMSPATTAPSAPTTPTGNQPVQNVSTESALYNNTPPATQSVVNIVRSKPNVRLVKYDPKEDVFLNPVKTKSKLAYNGVDEFTGKKRKEVQKEMLFRHTSENLKSLLKGRDYLTCTGFISSQTGGMKLLNLNFVIASDLAQQEFGLIDKGSVLTVKLLNGGTVKMINKKTNIGSIDPVNKTTEYNAQYIISNKDEKALTKSEADKVRVVWSTGYEDYEVYELDFFINQLKCITAK